jgi:uncharacterized protein YceH (UPF0502 family)
MDVIRSWATRLVLAATLLAAGCATSPDNLPPPPQSYVVLMSSTDGTAGKLSVRSIAGEAVLNQPRHGVNLDARWGGFFGRSDVWRVQVRQPPDRPLHFWYSRRMTRQLSLLETRVLGTLYEKQHTVPDSYPLTLNSLVSGCNQKTSRSPVMEVSEAEVQAALDSLKGANLVMETSGGRAQRYSHNVERVLQVPSQSAAILTVLMLRGPQTAGELRINCERLHSFADISAVQGFLDELAARPAGPLVIELPRLPGARENRWAHLLSGTPEVEVVPSTPKKDDLASTVARLDSEVAALKELVARIAKQLGIS